jgi:hypothetical protein
LLELPLLDYISGAGNQGYSSEEETTEILGQTTV